MAGEIVILLRNNVTTLYFKITSALRIFLYKQCLTKSIPIVKDQKDYFKLFLPNLSLKWVFIHYFKKLHKKNAPNFYSYY